MTEIRSEVVKACTVMPPREEYIASVSNEILFNIWFCRDLFPAPAKVVIFFEMKLSELIQKINVTGSA
jgi:hypothetical protein